MHRGYVKMFRKIIEWEWYKDSNTKNLFLHLLIKANHKETRYMGYTIPKGSLVTGRKALAFEIGISEKSVRTSFDKLKTTGEVAIKTASKFSIVTICNYSSYQSDEEIIGQPSGQQVASKWPASGQQVATSKALEALEALKNEKNNTLPNLFVSPMQLNTDISKHIPPPIESVKEYCKSRNNGVDADKWFSFYESKGWMIGKSKMKNWQAAVRTWEKNAAPVPQLRPAISQIPANLYE